MPDETPKPDATPVRPSIPPKSPGPVLPGNLPNPVNA